MFHNKPQLSVTHAITVNDYSLWQIIIYVMISLESGCGKVQRIQVLTIISTRGFSDEIKNIDIVR